MAEFVGRFTIDRHGEWLDTGIGIDKNDVYTFIGLGEIDIEKTGTNPYKYPNVGVDGDPRHTLNSHPINWHLRHGCLMGKLNDENNFVKIGTGLDYQHPHTKNEPYTLAVASNVVAEHATGAFEVLVLKKANYAESVTVANFRVKAPTASSKWQDPTSGAVTVKKGQKLLFASALPHEPENQPMVHGEFKVDTKGKLDGNPSTSGDGEFVKADQDFLAPGLRQYALVGRIGTGKPFEVGNKNEVVAPDEGPLQLALNDDELKTNTGYVDVVVVVAKA